MARASAGARYVRPSAFAASRIWRKSVFVSVVIGGHPFADQISRGRDIAFPAGRKVAPVAEYGGRAHRSLMSTAHLRSRQFCIGLTVITGRTAHLRRRSHAPAAEPGLGVDHLTG